RIRNLTVIDIDAASVAATTALLQRGMRLTAMVQDGELQLISDSENVVLTPRILMGDARPA
ncbi:MAG TPA: YaeQ family protein, partial [Luteimonas sp.]|nr:YaeQ family protein [Luteimonas sp.]